MEITAQELKEKIKNGDKILVDFWASWCGPCRILKPEFEKASKSYEGDLQFFTLNIDNDTDFAVHEMNIFSVPTIKGFKDGQEVYNSVGLKNHKDLIEIAKNI
jgi:thioredoxin 1